MSCRYPKLLHQRLQKQLFMNCQVPTTPPRYKAHTACTWAASFCIPPIIFKSIMRTLHSQHVLRYDLPSPKALGAFHRLCCASGEHSVHRGKARTTNPILLGQRFPKRGMQNNCSRNKDALFILRDRYLFIYFFEH